MNTQQIKMKKILNDPKTVIVDTETTGLEDNARIIELSVLGLDGTVLYSSLFNPEMVLPEKVVEITGLTDADLINQPLFENEVDTIENIIYGKTIVGWNIDFDIRRLQYEYSRLGMFFCNDSIDIMPIYAEGMGLQRNRYKKFTRKLLYAKQDLGIGDSQDHRSLEDCRDTLAVMQKFVELSDPNPEMCPDWAVVNAQNQINNKKTTFLNAVQAVMAGKRMTNGVVTNGELEELVIIMDCPFMLIQRPQQNSSSKLTKTPSVNDVLSTDWSEIV